MGSIACISSEINRIPLTQTMAATFLCPLSAEMTQPANKAVNQASNALACLA